MFFKREDILKIHNALLQLGVKDSELPNAEPVTYNDTLSIVQEGKNKQIGIKDFFNQISLWKKEDFINITDEYDKYNISLLEAINLVPTLQRKNGLVITFQDVEGNWEIYQFRGDITEFFNKEKWFDLYDYRNNIIQSIVPDEEDLTVSTPDENGNSLISLKDRVYDPTSFSGKGYKILRKNIQSVNIASTKITITEVPSSDGTLSFTINGKETQIAVSATTDNTTALVSQKVATALQESMTEYDVSIDASLITLTRKSSGLVTPSVFSASTTGVVCTITDSTKREFRNILISNMINQPNTIYEIRYDFTLSEDITIPDNCILKFNGGSISGNYSITGNGCVIDGNPDIQCIIIGISNQITHLNWFTKETNKNTAFNRAIACAGVSVLDGDNKSINLSETITFTAANKCDLKNLIINFTASAANQNMFLFNTPEDERYTGNHGTISHCKFTLTNPASYQNVHCIHYRVWDSTARGKIDDVQVINFSGYMFICESYLQEFEFNRFKGSACGGFISFNKEYETANSFGTWRKGSSNVIRFINSGIDDGRNGNNTITDVVDLTGCINVTFEDCVFQGNSAASFTSVLNIEPASRYIANIVARGLWIEFTNNRPTYGVVIAANSNFVSNTKVRNINITGVGVTVEVPTDKYWTSNLFTIATGAYPTIKIKGDAETVDNTLKPILDTYGAIANVIFNLDYSRMGVENLTPIYFNRGIVEDQLPNMKDVIDTNHINISTIRQYGLDILRITPKYSAPSYPIFATKQGLLNFDTMKGRSLVFRVIYRIYPLTEVTEENKDTFTFSLAENSNIFRGTDKRSAGFVAGQSQNPDDAIWHEVIVNPFLPSTSSKLIYGLGQYVGLDYAVCKLYFGQADLDDGITIDPSDNTKLINAKATISSGSAISGATASRPVNVPVGYQFFDTTLGKPIYASAIAFNGTITWVDATGADV